jgi:Immunity protein 8
MKPVLKYIHTQDGDEIENFNPEISDNFWNLISLGIGPDSEEGCHDYSIQLCTPRALDHLGQHDGPVWGRHHLIVNYFDGAELRSIIEKKIAICTRPTFEETAVLLSRHFAWEFEDYQE